MPTMLARQGSSIPFRSSVPFLSHNVEKKKGLSFTHDILCTCRMGAIHIVSDQDIAGNSSPLQADSGCIAVVSIHRQRH